LKDAGYGIATQVDAFLLDELPLAVANNNVLLWLFGGWKDV